MKKKIIFISLIFLLITLGACGSPSKESEELADYYNSYVDTVHPIGEKIDELSEKLIIIEDDQEALEYHMENIVPLVQEVNEFINSIDPESDIVQELHDLRSKQLNTWDEGFSLRTEAFETAAEGDKEKAVELVNQSDQKFAEAQQRAFEADEKFVQLAKENDVKIVDEEEND